MCVCVTVLCGALVHLRRVGRSVCEKIQSVHRIWRGARYGDRSIGDDWTVDHPVKHVRDTHTHTHTHTHHRILLIFLDSLCVCVCVCVCVCLAIGKKGHKDMHESRFRLLRLYYTNRIFMGVCCVSTEVLYLCLFMARDRVCVCGVCVCVLFRAASSKRFHTCKHSTSSSYRRLE